MKKVTVGIIGCGNISGIYCEASKKFPLLDIIACADLDRSRAEQRAKQYNIPNVYTVEELLADPTIDIVINLTIPQAHGDVSLAALHAGKHVYVEKPLAITRKEGKKVMDLAKEKGLLVGCAPDTFLGGGIQTCRKLIDDGAIGQVIGATAFMMSPGHEGWHPDPEFYYKKGGGPMLDMGPYYLTTLIYLLGPIQRVTGSARASFKEREITSQSKAGQKIEVEVPTHIAGVLDFESGAMATIITSFDVAASQLPFIEIYGSKGTLIVPDPNTFGGPVYLRQQGKLEWEEMPLTSGFIENSRGIGVADMAEALRTGRPHRANGELAYHVLDVMESIHNASATGSHYELESTCKQPSLLNLK